MKVAKSLQPNAHDRQSLWHRVLTADPEGLVTQSPEWMNALVSLGSWGDATQLYEMPDSRLAVLPMAQRRRLGITASPPAAWGFGGIIAEGGVTADDIRHVVRDLDGRLQIRQTIRPNPLQAEAWAAGAAPGWQATDRFAHVIDLRDGQDAVWSRIDKDVRRRVRRAERLGVEVECDTTGRLVPLLHELLQTSIERWAKAQNEPIRLARARARRRDPIEKFHAMATHLGPRFKLWIARHEGRPVAANLVLQGQNAHATRGAMDRNLAGPVSATALLEWSAIKNACEAGCSHYHMGESGKSASIARTKRHFGATGHNYSEYERERLPVSTVDRWARSAVKRLIGFRD